MDKKYTNRGFAFKKFTDIYNIKCSIQKSSNIESCIWLGVDDPEPKIIKQGIGWIPYKEIPENVLLTTRMHLDKKLAKQLIKELKYFVRTGNLK